MSKIIKVYTLNGEEIEYYDKIIGSGGMKDVYFSTDNQNAVAFFRDPLDDVSIERLMMITTTYKDNIFNNIYGGYWKKILCWPEKIVFDGQRHGIVLPKYDKEYFFEYGSYKNDILKIKGNEKEGKWFSTPKNRLIRLDSRERGDWRMYLKICLMVSRAVRRLHAAGLAHSDLSYKNVLISPILGSASIIDIDGLVVPGKYPPDVVGTPDFIAPEVVKTSNLDKNDPKRVLPSRYTDRHALAILIYQYLLLRHPLRGKKIHDDDPEKDELLTMGENALFIEHTTDKSNRLEPSRNKDDIVSKWEDIDKLPYSITGPYLSKLFEKAFIDGLHNPQKRPTADEWESALIKTIDLIQPCDNDKCEAKWYVFDNTIKPKCPFCNTTYKGQLPVINLYSDRNGKGKYISDNHRIMIYKDQSIFPWHIDRNIIPNERLQQKDSQRVAYCIFHNNKWLFVNEKINDLLDYTDSNNIKKIDKGDYIVLEENTKILVKQYNSARLMLVQLVKG